ncbi:MAG: 4-vinyl reductase [Chloroflexota bacterium]
MSSRFPDSAITPGFEADPVVHSHAGRGPHGSLASRALDRALTEIIGCTEAASPGPVQDIPDLSRTLEARCGQRAARGIALRVGSACFTHVVRRIGDQAGLTQPAFRLLPLSLRLRQGLLAFRGLLTEFSGRGARVEEQDGRLFWRLPDCPICAGLRASEPICFLMLGMLEQALSWLSGGKVFDVQEIACRARGDEDCIFLIEPSPVEL